jgi:hypothetical protein
MAERESLNHEQTIIPTYVYMFGALLMATTSSKVFTITEAQYEDLAEGYGGICLACGEIQEGEIEPDAEDYQCDSCGEMKFYGIEQALISGRIAFSDDE